MLEYTDMTCAVIGLNRLNQAGICLNILEWDGIDWFGWKSLDWLYWIEGGCNNLEQDELGWKRQKYNVECCNRREYAIKV